MSTRHMTSAPTVASGATPRLRRGRALHLWDGENLLGTASPTTEQVAAAWSAYRPLVQPGDHVTVASSHHAAPAMWFGTGGGGRLLVRSGPDGADLALLESVDLEHLTTRYEWLVIASGDHVFAPLMESARSRGTRTWQVTGVGRGAVALARAAQVHSRLRVTRAAPAAALALAA